MLIIKKTNNNGNVSFRYEKEVFKEDEFSQIEIENAKKLIPRVFKSKKINFDVWQTKYHKQIKEILHDISYTIYNVIQIPGNDVYITQEILENDIVNFLYNTFDHTRKS